MWALLSGRPGGAWAPGWWDGLPVAPAGTGGRAGWGSRLSLVITLPLTAGIPDGHLRRQQAGDE